MMRVGVSRALLGLLVMGSGLVYLGLPRRSLALATAPTGTTQPLRGALHIHTDRSDGTGSLDEVAASAARANLSFIVVTDHGDATRGAAPTYKSGVLCIDAAEISTDGGHVIAFGVQRAPYPLAGESRDVLEDIQRLGGMSIVTHPTSERAELRWTDVTLPFDGLEWLNGDSEWRNESAGSLARGLATYWFRAPETLALFLDRPEASLELWDSLTRRRRVVGLASGDAHARIGLGSGDEPYNRAVALRAPGYEQVFRTFSINLPDLRLTGDALADADLVVDTIQRGHVYSTVDALAAPAYLRFTALSGDKEAQAGDTLQPEGPITLRAESNAPANAQITLFRDGHHAAMSSAPVLEHKADATPAVYRIEIEIPGAPGRPPVPWVVSNPIYVGGTASPSRNGEPPRPATEFSIPYSDQSASEWQVERNERSSGIVDVVGAVGGKQLSMRFALAGARSDNPYVAFVAPVGPTLSAYTQLAFKARSSRPMRVSVQLRAPNSEEGERWQRLVYLDEDPRQVTVFFEDLSPKSPAGQRRLVLSDVRSLLFVVDGINTALGSSGQFWLDDVKYGR